MNALSQINREKAMVSLRLTMSYFDYKKVQKFMRNAKWTWEFLNEITGIYEEKIPNIEDLMRITIGLSELHLIEMERQMKVNKNGIHVPAFGSSSGGLELSYSPEHDDWVLIFNVAAQTTNDARDFEKALYNDDDIEFESVEQQEEISKIKKMTQDQGAIFDFLNALLKPLN